MKLLIAGACGFVGSTLARAWAESGAPHQLAGFDSFARPGSETNRLLLQRRGVQILHADVRSSSDVEGLPEADFVIDAAAHPSVLAGADGRLSPRQVVEHNLLGTLNLLEYCRRRRAGFILLSTSRVYSARPLAGLAVRVQDGAYVPVLAAGDAPAGLSAEGVAERFPTAPPLSLYGATKLASEVLALEYGAAYSFPVWIDRCGLLAGAGQFGRADQGILAYWIHAWLRRAPLCYTGFGGEGHQVRECLHPADLVPLLDRQMAAGPADRPRTVNVGGGAASALSLLQLSQWCQERLGPHAVTADPRERPNDVPWLVLDAALARKTWDWAPRRRTADVLEDILRHAQENPAWLELSGAP